MVLPASGELPSPGVEDQSWRGFKRESWRGFKRDMSGKHLKRKKLPKNRYVYMHITYPEHLG